MQPISYHITPLIINALGADTHTHTHTHVHMNKKNFKKPGVLSLQTCMPGLTSSYLAKKLLTAHSTGNIGYHWLPPYMAKYWRGKILVNVWLPYFWW